MPLLCAKDQWQVDHLAEVLVFSNGMAYCVGRRL
jgi:hypothetical protein